MRAALLGLTALSSLSLLGCGWASAVIGGAASSGGSSGSGNDNSPTIVSGLVVPDTAAPPVTISFTLTDEESDPANVDLVVTYVTEDGTTLVVNEAMQVGTDLSALPTSPDGVGIEVTWDYVSQIGSASYQTVTVRAIVEDGSVNPSDDLTSGVRIGNDPPAVAFTQVPSLAEGPTVIELTLTDTSSDDATLQIDFLDPTDGQWKPAAVTGGLTSQPTSESGLPLSFTWQSSANLPSYFGSSQLRASIGDTDEGTPVDTQVTVDNNFDPIAFIDSGAVLVNPDSRRSIPVPFQIIEPDEHPVTLVWQWQRTGRVAPALPSSPDNGHPHTMDDILGDPQLRRIYQIADESPRVFSGRPTASPGPLATTIRLPELASTARGLVALGLEQRLLEILRTSRMPSTINGDWASNPLDGPVACLPIGSGESALVLDSRSAAGWRLREVHLATGTVIRDIVTNGLGIPTAAANGLDKDTLLIATLEGTEEWSLNSVDLDTVDSVTRVYSAAPADQIVAQGTDPDSDGETPLGPVYGIAPLGTEATLVTVGNSIVRVKHAAFGSSASTTIVRSGLQGPRTIFLDPLRPQRLYVVEELYTQPPTLPGRIASLQLNTNSLTTVAYRHQGTAGAGFPYPTALALDRLGARLLVVVEPTDGQKELRGVDIGSPALGEVFVVGPLPDSATSLATGPDALTVVAAKDSDQLLVSGGIEQSRPIAPGGVDMATQTVTVDAAFDPPLNVQRIADRSWRVQAKLPSPFEADQGSFLWDTQSVPLGLGEVELRLTPYDRQRGDSDDQSKTIARFDEATIVGDPVLPAGVTVAGDLDRDGMVELVQAGVGINVFEPSGPGRFEDPAATVLNAAHWSSPSGLELSDLNEDGHLDVVSAWTTATSSEPSALAIHWGPGFVTLQDHEPIVDTALGKIEGIRAADFDRDGSMELLVAQAGARVLYSQQSASPTWSGAWFAGSPTSVGAADLNGDGTPDAIVAEPNGLSLFLQLTNGTLTAQPDCVETQAGGSLGAAVSILAADLNSDGLCDLATAHGGAGAPSGIAIFPQHHSNCWSAPFQYRIGVDPSSLTAADINGDSRLDLLATDCLSNTVIAYLQEPEGTFAVDPDLQLRTGALVKPLNASTEDLDGDGRVDLVVGIENNSARILLQSAPGRFLGPPRTVVQQSAALRDFDLGDLDGDGDLDIVTITETSGSKVSVFLQSTPGSFSLGAHDDFIGPAFLADASVKLQDMNGDGHLDIIARGASEMRLVLQSEDALFPAPPLLIPFPAPVSASFDVADLDESGEFNIIVSDFWGDSLVWFSTQGSTVEDFDIPLPGGDRPVGVMAVDIDKDGHIDLLSTHVSGGVSAYFQTVPLPGSSAVPTFSAGQPLISFPTQLPCSITDLAVGDLDEDGDLDVVAASPGHCSAIYIAWQTAPQVFDVAMQTTLPADAPVAVDLADIDHDQDLDIVATSFSTNTTTVLIQTNPGDFHAAQVLPLGGSTLQIADVDGDGDLDIALARVGVTVFFGSH